MTILLWTGFIIFILGMLAFDLGVLRKESRVVSSREALRWSGFCVLLAILFTGVVYVIYENQLFGTPTYGSMLTGKEAAMQFFTGWLVEQSLSIDNIFVIAVIFSFFGVPLQYQHRVLFWGILGALVMRGVMIAIGAALIRNFSWVNYLFGALLIYAAIKLLTVKDEEFDPEKNFLYRLAKRFYPVTTEYDGEKFITIKNGVRTLTPLALVLIVVESTDLLFAVDSIPAVFAITSDPFLVFTSNVFAILNLRSLYFALSALIARFAYLKTALVVVLLFIGFKMALVNHFHMSTGLSLGIIVLVLGAGIGASFVLPARTHKVEEKPLVADPLAKSSQIE